MKIQEQETQRNIKDMVDEKTQKQFDDFQKNIKKETEQPKIAEVFNEISRSALQMISLDIKNNFISMNEKKLQTYTQVIEAFKQDAKTLDIKDYYLPKLILEIQNGIDLKQIIGITDKTRLEELKTFAEKNNKKNGDIILPLNTELDKILITINEKITTITATEETDKKAKETTDKKLAIDTLNTTDFATLFDTGEEENKKNFDAVMEFIFSDTATEKKEIKSTTEDPYEKQLFDLVKEKMKVISDPIIIGKASETFGNKFLANTWLIQYDATAGKEKYVLRGTNEYIEKNKAEKADQPKGKGAFDKNVFDIKEQGMDTFNDDTGNFEGLRIYMNKQNAEYMKSYLPTIMKGINNYETTKLTYTEDTAGTYILDKTTKEYRLPTKDEILVDGTTKYKETEVKSTEADPTFIKNGYANVLTDYVIAHPELIGVYFDNFNPNDLNLLGADEITRTNNYNRLLFSDVENDILTTNIQNYIKGLKPEAQQAFLTKIGDIKEAITGKEKMNTAETVKEGFDKLINQFGPILFNVLKFFGMNKTSLLKRFPNSEARINEEFQKEYGLGEDKKTAVDTIANTIGGNTKFDRDYEKKGDPTAKDLKENFTKTNNYIDTYITELIKNDKSEKGTNNLQYLNLSVFDTAVKTYNKKAEQKVNILDIVDIETKKIDGKEMKNINKIKDGQEDIFKKIMAAYLDSDTPWINVANSNKQITTETTYKEGEITKPAGKNEQGIDKGMMLDYRITTQQQLVKYLTASLFSNKDLSYVITENGLKGEHPNKNINNEPKNTKLDIQQKYIADNGILKDVEPVTINDIFAEFDKAPDNLMFTKKGETVGKEIKKGEINGKKTYVYTADMTKVTIHDGDKIEAIPLTANTAVIENETSEEKKTS